MIKAIIPNDPAFCERFAQNWPEGPDPRTLPERAMKVLKEAEISFIAYPVTANTKYYEGPALCIEFRDMHDPKFTEVIVKLQDEGVVNFFFWPGKLGPGARLYEVS